MTDLEARSEAVRFGALHEAAGGPWENLFNWWWTLRNYDVGEVEQVRAYVARLLAAHRSG